MSKGSVVPSITVSSTFFTCDTFLELQQEPPQWSQAGQERTGQSLPGEDAGKIRRDELLQQRVIDLIDDDRVDDEIADLLADKLWWSYPRDAHAVGLVRRDGSLDLDSVDALKLRKDFEHLGGNRQEQSVRDRGKPSLQTRVSSRAEKNSDGCTDRVLLHQLVEESHKRDDVVHRGVLDERLQGAGKKRKKTI
jgi:hypothetical protein